MEDHIRQALAALEEERQLTILYACESGSRAWGFASPDSDFDIRFIYIRALPWYLSIDERKDSIVLPLTEDRLDFSGWDVRKALRLFRKSNATLLEWLHSPVLYRADPAFLQRMRRLEPDFLSARRLVHHYLGLAHNVPMSWRSHTDVPAKHFFYILRALLAARWVVDRQQAPPVAMEELIELVPADSEERSLIHDLLHFKRRHPEAVSFVVNAPLKHYLKDVWKYCREKVGQLPDHRVDSTSLDELFFDLLHR